VSIHVKHIKLGPLDNFIYIVYDTVSREAFVVDPGWDASIIQSQLVELNLILKYIVLTHGHYDHKNALNDLLSFKNVPVYISKYEVSSLKPKHSMLIEITKEHTLNLAEFNFSIIETPGHTPGGLCLLHNLILISGDTLFVDGCGRCDFENSNVSDMYDSLQTLKSLNKDIIVYPGHDYGTPSFTTIGHLKKTNRFLICKSREEFIRKRMWA
jgi:hydroxyacylglutathione hydrolase